MRMRDQKVAFGMDALAAKEGKVDEGLGKISRSAKQAEAEMTRFAKQTEKIHAAPAERFTERFKKLEAAFASGKLGLVAYSNAMAKTRAEFAAAQADFDGTTARVKKQGEAEAEAAKMAEWYARVKTNSAKLEHSEKLRMLHERQARENKVAADSAKMAQWMDRVKMNSARLATSEYARLSKEQEQAQRRARQEQQQAFSQSALGQITQFAAGYLTLGKAVQIVGDAFRHARQESREALSSLKGLDDARRKLAQLATDMPAGSLEKLTARADAAAGSSGVDRAKAYEILFQAHSFGFEDQYEDVMAMNPIIDASSASQLAGKVREMGGRKLSPRQLINMAMEAGKPTPADAESMAGALAIAAEGGRRVGASPEEMMAAVSRGSIYFAGKGEAAEGDVGAVRTAANRYAATAHKLAATRPDLASLGVFGGLEKITSEGQASVADFVKENQEVGAYYSSWLETKGALGADQARIVAARDAKPGSDNVGKGVRLRALDPASQAVIALNRAEIAKEVAKEGQLGIQEANRQKAIAQGEMSSYQANLGIMQRGGINIGTKTAEAFEAGPATTTGLQATGALAAGMVNGDMASGGGGFWQFVANLIANQYKEQVTQTEVLKQIRDNKGNSGGVGRSVSSAALAPQS